jgi:hypothetical protein
MHIFTASALPGCQLHVPAALLPVSTAHEVERTREPVWTTWRREKFLTLPGLEPRPVGRPARCQSLYRLRYPGSNETATIAF